MKTTHPQFYHPDLSRLYGTIEAYYSNRDKITYYYDKGYLGSIYFMENGKRINVFAPMYGVAGLWQNIKDRG